MNRLRPVSVFAILFAMLGCATSTPPTTAYYLLRGEAVDHLESSPAALGRVTVAAYLDQSGLVLASGDNEITPARYHLWAEPLDQGVRSLLRDNISQHLGFDVASRTTQTPVYVIHVHLDQLHGSTSGSVIMVADVHIDHAGMTLDTFRLATSRAMDRDGYAAMVEAEKMLLDELGRTIADRLKQALQG